MKSNSSIYERNLRFEHWFCTVAEIKEKVLEVLRELHCHTATRSPTITSSSPIAFTASCGETLVQFELHQEYLRLSRALPQVPIVRVVIAFTGLGVEVSSLRSHFEKLYSSKTLRAGG